MMLPFFLPVGGSLLAGLWKKIKKKFGKGITFLVVPNSYGSVKSIAIPFPVIILILLIIIFNVLVFVGFTTQVREIYHIRKEIWNKDLQIARLKREQKEIQPTLEKSKQILEELNRLKMERAKLMNTWKSIQQKGGRLNASASRSTSVRVPQYTLVNATQEKNMTALAELHSSLEQLERFINEEQKEQEILHKQLLAYEVKLDHTPSSWPVASRKITSWFGNRYHPVYRQYRYHSGIDIQAGYGSKVTSAADGVVSFAGYQGGYGYTVIIDHGYGYQTLYAHNSKILVRKGQRVEKGQLICYSGNSGTSTGPHLHFEVRVGGKVVNPMLYLRN